MTAGTVAATWRLVPTRSAATFRAARPFGLGAVSGAFSVTSGGVEVTDGESRVRVVLDARSVRTGSPAWDRVLRRILDVERFPEVRYAGAVDSGALSAHGWEVSNGPEVTSVDRRGDRVLVRASAVVDRYSHGLTGWRWMVGRYVEVDLVVTLVRVLP